MKLKIASLLITMLAFALTVDLANAGNNYSEITYCSSTIPAPTTPCNSAFKTSMCAQNGTSDPKVVYGTGGDKIGGTQCGTCGYISTDYQFRVLGPCGGNLENDHGKE